MILYINNEHCSSVEQLKGYFTEDLTPGSDIYADLQDYGRHDDIAKWLREMGEPEMADRVESIPKNLSDSVFYTQLKAAITGSELKDAELLKPSFDKCFAFEGTKCVLWEKEAKITISLKVLMCVNEEYELSVSSNWGTRALMINPYKYTEGKPATIDFTLRKRPGKDIGETTVMVDGKEIKSIKSSNNQEGNDHTDQSINDIAETLKKVAEKVKESLENFERRNEHLSLIGSDSSGNQTYSRENSSFDWNAYIEKSEQVKREYAKKQEQERMRKQREEEKQEDEARILRWRKRHHLD